MESQKQFQIKGIQTSSNPIQYAEGMNEALNIVIDRPSIAESRRGMKKKYNSTAITNAVNKDITKLFEYNDKLFACYDSKMSYESGTATFTEYGTAVTYADDNIGLREAIAGNKLFFTTANGIMKVEDVGYAMKLAGIPKAINSQYTLGVATAGYVTAKSQVAYRFVWCYKDKYGIISQGAPSQRLEVIYTPTKIGKAWTRVATTATITSVGHGYASNDYLFMTDSDDLAAIPNGIYQITVVDPDTFTITVPNAGAAAGVVSYFPSQITVRVYIPAEIDTTYFLQAYRTYQSIDDTTIADDNEYLVYEAYPTNTDITNKYMEFVDAIPEELLGAALYTNQLQEGILQSNERPQFAKDITRYKDYLFLANVRSLQQFNLTMLSVGAPNGVQVNDTITIAGVTYTADTSESNNHFIVYSSYASLSENIQETAKSLVKAINISTSNTLVYAYYMSSFNDIPGRILIQRRDLTNTVFNLTSSRGGAYSPTLPTSGTTIASESETRTNRVFFSKFQQPEAFPVLNYIDAGDSNYAITRIIGLRTSLFIFKENGEIWRLTGEGETSFDMKLFDNTVNLYGPKTAVVFNNQIFCFTNQGISSVSDSGVQVMSFKEIENQIKPYLSIDNYPNFQKEAFAIGYESDRKYLFIPSIDDEHFIFSSFTSEWTKWDLNYSAGCVRGSEDKLYWAADDGFIYSERKDLDIYDYADEDFAVNIVSQLQKVLTMTSVSGISVGMTIKQGDNYSYITAIDTTNKKITLEDYFIFTAGAASIFTPIECTIKSNPLFLGDPSLVKRYSEISFFFYEMNDKFSVYFSNNFNELETEQILSPNQGFGWGQGAWGQGVWGGYRVTQSQENRTYFPLDLQRALWQHVKVFTDRAFTKFSLIGVTLFGDVQSQRFTKEGL